MADTLIDYRVDERGGWSGGWCDGACREQTEQLAYHALREPLHVVGSQATTALLVRSVVPGMLGTVLPTPGSKSLAADPAAIPFRDSLSRTALHSLTSVCDRDASDRKRRDRLSELNSTVFVCCCVTYGTYRMERTYRW